MAGGRSVGEADIKTVARSFSDGFKSHDIFQCGQCDCAAAAVLHHGHAVATDGVRAGGKRGGVTPTSL